MVKSYRAVAKKVVQKHGAQQGKDPTKLMRIHVNQFRECARFGMYIYTALPKGSGLSTVVLEHHLLNYYKDKLIAQLMP